VQDDGLTIKMVNFNSEMLLSAPIASFAFNLQPYIFPVFYEDETKVALSHRRNSKNSRTSVHQDALDEALEETQKDKEKRNKHIIYSAMGISFVVYMTAGTQQTTEIDISLDEPFSHL